MLGIQSSLPVTNTVKFKGESFIDKSQEYCDFEELPNDEFSKKDIEAERDQKLAEIEKTQTDLNDFADSLDKNSDKVSKKASKVLRFTSAVLGLGSSFLIAKYSSKLSIEALKGLKNSKTAESFIKGAGSVVKPLKSGFEVVSKTFKKVMAGPLVQKIKNSKVGQGLKNLAEKPLIKGFLEQAKGYKEATKELVKSVKGEKIQSLVENTVAASATASVLIDDLAGRNDNKSNLELALGASGGDK